MRHYSKYNFVKNDGCIITIAFYLFTNYNYNDGNKVSFVHEFIMQKEIVYPMNSWTVY